MHRSLLSILVPAVLATAPAGVAQASVLTYEGPTDNEVLVLRGAPGEVDRVGVQPGPIADSVSLYDPDHRITSWPHQCARTDYSVDCHAPNGARFELGDGDDDAYLSSDVTVAITMLGGPGNDQLAGNDRADTLLGGPGDDILKGAGGNDLLDGGEGDDTLEGYSGSDRLLGGSGDDLLVPDAFEAPSADVVDGGPGVDRIEGDYTTRNPDAPQPPSAFTLEGGADDGRPGEGDDVRDVERLVLSRSATVVGTAADEYVKLHQVGDGGRLEGRGGADELRGGDGADTIDGGSGDDLLDGGYGDDTITGGPGRDRISADGAGDCGPLWCKYPNGNDVVLARDGEVDSITCGPGTDRVEADADDVVAPDCETVLRPGTTSGGTSGSGGGTGSGPGTGTAGSGPGKGPTAGVRLRVPAGQRLGTVLRRGLQVRLSSRRAIVVRATHGGRLVARATAKNGRVVLRPGTAAGRRLARARSVRLVLTAGTARTVVTLRR